MTTPSIIKNDPYLSPFEHVIVQRMKKAKKKETELIKQTGSLSAFATGYLFFGLHKTHDGWVMREWAPNATAIYLIGVFNNWTKDEKYKFTSIPNHCWELKLDGTDIKHGDLYRLIICWEGCEGDRIPAWTRRVVQDESTKMFSSQVWDPEKPYAWKAEHVANTDLHPMIYEAHIGMATEDEKVGTYEEFRKYILPRIKKAGYNTLQLMAIQEHPYYGSFGYHVSNFFAPSSRFGTPEELKALIDDAHEAGMAVIMDIVHSHAVKNENEGLGKFDGTRYQYFHDGARGEHVAWDSLCFNYSKNEVLHFLLSNCKYWLDEFKFDGFRFDGVTSMLYLDHGLSRDFTEYSFYFDGNQDEDAITYFMLANKLIKQVHPRSVTIAEEMSGMPGLAASLDDGGLGFDYRMAMGVPDNWIKIIKERSDENWDVSHLYYELISRRPDEKTVNYAESHDQALVGDKTIIFRLIDKEMYFNMHKSDKNLKVDRGMALHKMIRLVTITTGGGAYLNFMGNEFGHPEWIDFPREGNNWSFKYARRQWSLLDNKELRFHYLADFDRDMIILLTKFDIYAEQWPYLICDNTSDQVLAFERAGLVFIFNFSPVNSYTDYGIKVHPGKYEVVLNSDSELYGGFGRIDESMTYFAQKYGKLTSENPYYLKIYLPVRTGIVMKRIAAKSIFDLG